MADAHNKRFADDELAAVANDLDDPATPAGYLQREEPRLVQSRAEAPQVPRPQVPVEKPAPMARETAPAARPAGSQAKPEPKVRVIGRRRGRVRWLLYALLPVALIAGLHAYVTGGQIMSTENAYVQADVVGVSTDVSGIVKEVAVHENQPVKSGDVLFRLDDRQYRYAVTRAEAQVDNTRNAIDALKANYQDLQAQIRQAQDDIDFYQREFQRQQDLSSRQFASQSTFDLARHNLQTAQQKMASLKAQLAGIVANLNGNPNIKTEDHPRYIDSIAQRDEAVRQLDNATVRAPIDGIATNVTTLQPGQYIAAATAALTATTALNVVATGHLWIQANPKETELTYVKPGQHATVTVDTYPGVEWDATVESINPASASTFSLLPAQNTSGNWVKVVQRIPMRVRVETPAGKPSLRVGMSVVVNVDTGQARGLPAFLDPLVQWWKSRHG
jgi:membrane fusion protein (multidrug efflux system)